MAIKLDEARIRSLTANLLNGGVALNSLNYGSYALPLAGGKMTGTIHLGSTGLRTHDDTHGYYTDQYGNFFHCSNTSTDNWNVHNAAGSMSLKYYFETGALEIPTSLKMNTWNITDDGNCIYFRKASKANIVSDTFGFAIGETDEAQTPLAVSGRVLAYPLEPREEYCAGDPVCSGPNGTVSKMTREEVMMYPDRIIGTVSSVPNYDTWGTGNVKIWIKVR